MKRPASRNAPRAEAHLAPVDCLHLCLVVEQHKANRLEKLGLRQASVRAAGHESRRVGGVEGVLLRHKLAISTAEEFQTGSSFHRVLWDDAQHGNSDTQLVADDKIKRVVMCSGKVYYDLLEERDARGIDDIYLLRFEQFYPFPAQSAVKELERFKQAEMVWCQEEPKNQGAWTFIEPNIEWVLGRIKAKNGRPEYVGRATAASPATGLASQHKAQQAALVDEALTIKGN